MIFLVVSLPSPIPSSIPTSLNSSSVFAICGIISCRASISGPVSTRIQPHFRWSMHLRIIQSHHIHLLVTFYLHLISSTSSYPLSSYPSYPFLSAFRSSSSHLTGPKSYMFIFHSSDIINCRSAVNYIC